ncbi:Dna-directed rna polymerase iii subunit rpc4 [Thalictrum thalictroides]|uniref:Dna-directed rna polymerase iii subunit rpc4 n=1 Tax=Thalictrum thalictroides TaxID=46969 RepID=A0A7J6V084_THATH|nr:Dna-directed rna polymerase iii subunit rpc4 [Thalictrum thalictroides]
MEEEAPGTSSPRKVRFKPKVPSRRPPKSVENKIEVLPDIEAAQARELLRRVNEGSRRRGPKVERKSEPVQVAFGYTDKQTSIRNFGKRTSSTSSASSLQGSGSNDECIPLNDKITKEYAEPWNYYSYYPVTLPLRRPHSGNPEHLNEVEFGEASKNVEYDENSVSPAAELGLMEEYEGERMLFFQLPPSLPLINQSSSDKGKEIAGSSKPFRNMGLPEKGCGLEELTAGFMGKMLVYKSGAIKLKLGEIVYDVSPGSDCVFPQNVAAINVKEKHCCVLGELEKRAIITPDVDSLL